MLTYAQTWDAVVAALKAASATTGVAPESVAHGEVGRAMPMLPPALYVYLLPAEPAAPGARETLGPSYAPEAELAVFCLVPPASSSRDALTTAVALAERTLAVLRLALPAAGLAARWESVPIRLDEVTTKGATARVHGRVMYSPAEGPGTLPEGWPPVFPAGDGLTVDEVAALINDAIVSAEAAEDAATPDLALIYATAKL